MNYHGAEEYLANDKDKSIYEFHKIVMEVDESVIEGKRWKFSDSQFKYFSKLWNGYLHDARTKDFDVNLKGADLVLVMRYLNYYGVNGDTHTSINFGKISKKLYLPLKNFYIHKKDFNYKQVQLTNKDYVDFLKRLIEGGYFNDNRHYLLYFDPPYSDNSNSDRYDDNSINFEEFSHYLCLLNIPNICWVLSLPERDVIKLRRI